MWYWRRGLSSLLAAVAARTAHTDRWKISSMGPYRGSWDPLLEFWHPLYISRTVEYFKFGRQIDYSRKSAKLCQRVVKRSRGPLLKFQYPLYISGTVEARNFKFSTPMLNTIPMTINRSKSKPEVEFQYGGHPFS